jgi:hypothetical protein
VKDGLKRKFYTPSGQFFNVEGKERSDEQKSWVTGIEDSHREMTHHITRIAEVKDAEGKCNQQHREKKVGSAFSRSFIIDQQYNKYPEDDTTIN